MMETMEFQKVGKKKYSLNNSYFKNTPYGCPRTPQEVMAYYKQHNELPFEYSGENWLYDCWVEYQKRNGVHASQFFTPPSTSEQLAFVASRYFKSNKPVLDACCGFGMLTKSIEKYGFKSTGFDFAYDMPAVYKAYTGCDASQSRFEEFEGSFDQIISNPPYEVVDLTAFLRWLYRTLNDGGIAVLLIPNGFLDKERPKAIPEIVSKFSILDREEMTEDYARTKIKAEIVVLQK